MLLVAEVLMYERVIAFTRDVKSFNVKCNTIVVTRFPCHRPAKGCERSNGERVARRPYEGVLISP